MPKLTNNFISKIEAPEQGQVFFRDSELPGFGIRVTKGSKSFVAEGKVAGKFRRVTIGKHPVLTPEEARKQARVILGKMSAGEDPVKPSAASRKLTMTLREAFEDYMSSKDMRKNTQLSFNRVMNQCLADWLDMKITAITRAMVMEKYRQLGSGCQKGKGHANANLAMQALSATLNFVSWKYAEDGEPMLASNPVQVLRQTKVWYRLPDRQGVIPEHKLAAWYRAVSKLGNPTARDYYLVLIFTGLRRNEAAQLEWRDVDFEGKILTLRPEVNKTGREHQLPLSDFLLDLFRQRYASKKSEYVFDSYRRQGRYHGCYKTLRKLRQESGCDFMIHDLRRSFLTVAESVGTPHYALRKLAGHSTRGDITAGYLIMTVDRLREPMQKITDRLLQLMGIERSEKSA